MPPYYWNRPLLTHFCGYLLTQLREPFIPSTAESSHTRPKLASPSIPVARGGLPGTRSSSSGQPTVTEGLTPIRFSPTAAPPNVHSLGFPRAGEFTDQLWGISVIAVSAPVASVRWETSFVLPFARMIKIAPREPSRAASQALRRASCPSSSRPYRSQATTASTPSTARSGRRDSWALCAWLPSAGSSGRR